MWAFEALNVSSEVTGNTSRTSSRVSVADLEYLAEKISRTLCAGIRKKVASELQVASLWKRDRILHHRPFSSSVLTDRSLV